MFIMVLNDGETFTELKDCAILEINADDPEETPELEHYVKEAFTYGRAFEINQLYSIHKITQFS